MWSDLYSLIFHCWMVCYIIGIELKNKGHEKINTKVGKVFYWIVWAACILGNVWLIIRDIIEVIWANGPTAVFVAVNYNDLKILVIILVLFFVGFWFKKKGKK